MKIIANASELKLPGSVVSIGMFDGVHRGHRRVLGLLQDIGRGWGLPTVLVTFDPHPRAVLRPESMPALLSTLEDRMHLLAMTDAVDYCLVLPFDRQRSAESADDFVRATLLDRLGMCSLVVGENFACGRGRKGDVAYLNTLGAELGFAVHPVPLRSDSDSAGLTHCSSSETRRLIQMGDIGSAAAMLDRPHEMTCTVVAPDETGCRVIDVVVPDAICSPPAGDYSGVARKKDASAPWICATLQVREERLSNARTVRLFIEKDVGVTSGDAMILRFLDNMRHFGHHYANSMAALA